MLRLSRNVCIDTLGRQKARPRATGVVIEETVQVPSAAPTPEEAATARSARDLAVSRSRISGERDCSPRVMDTQVDSFFGWYQQAATSLAVSFPGNPAG